MAITFSGTSPSGIDFTESTLVADLYAQLDISNPASTYVNDFDRNLATNYIVRFKYYYVQSNSNYYLKLQWTLEKKSNDDTRWNIPSGTYVEESNSQFGQKGTSNAPAAYMYIGSECYPRNNSTWQSSPLRNITHTLYCTLDNITSPKEAIQFRYNWINNNITYSVETPLVSIPKAKTPYDDNVVFNKDGLNKFIKDLPKFVSDHAYPITIGSADSNDLNQLVVSPGYQIPILRAHSICGNKANQDPYGNAAIRLLGNNDHDNGSSFIFSGGGSVGYTSGEHSPLRIQGNNANDADLIFINNTSNNSAESLIIAGDSDIRMYTNGNLYHIWTIKKNTDPNDGHYTVERPALAQHQDYYADADNKVKLYYELNGVYGDRILKYGATIAEGLLNQTIGADGHCSEEYSVNTAAFYSDDSEFRFPDNGVDITLTNLDPNFKTLLDSGVEITLFSPDKMHKVFDAAVDGGITIGDGSGTINLNGNVSFDGTNNTGLASLIGTTSIGSDTQPIYWDGTDKKFKTTGSLNNYVPIAGGTMTGQLTISTSTGSSWYDGRDNAFIRRTQPNGLYHPIWSCKSLNGEWTCGTYDMHSGDSNYPHEHNNLYWTYITDESYTSRNNDSTIQMRINDQGYFTAVKVFNAVFNDYAEYRTTIDLTPGHVVVDQDDGSLACSTTRLQPGAQVISDTFGHAMGETETAKTPLAVAGRVLVYTFQPRENYHAGMAVCSAPNGTVDIMTREEIREYPDCIIGTVSEIPSYETWGSDNIKVDGRIWIKI